MLMAWISAIRCLNVVPLTSSSTSRYRKALSFFLYLSYERGCQEKNSPLLPCEGTLFALHPAQSLGLRCCELVAYILSVPRSVAGYMSSVSCFRWWFDALGS
jgi:hypothetical protein